MPDQLNVVKADRVKYAFPDGKMHFHIMIGREAFNYTMGAREAPRKEKFVATIESRSQGRLQVWWNDSDVEACDGKEFE